MNSINNLLLDQPRPDFEIMEMLLLVLLSALLAQEGEAQGNPPTNLPSRGVQLYLPYENRTLPDYSGIRGDLFFNNDANGDGINDALWCQSANSSSNIGVWYFPDGTQVPLTTEKLNSPSAPDPVFSKRFSGQIALVNKRGLTTHQGLYKCIIPDENGVDQTLVVGAYRNSVYNMNDGPDADPTMQFSLLSTSRLATPPVFSLSFNVSDGPPTFVSCSVNGNGISTELSRVIVNGPGSVTGVTVTVRLREAGNYQCTVSNYRVTNGTINNVTAINGTTSLNISVPSTPTGFTATRSSTGLTHVILSWSAASGAIGYEVYYQLSDNTPISIDTTTNTTFNVTSILMLGNIYTFYVVSYVDNDAFLPSENSSTIISLGNPEVTDLMATDITSTSFSLAWSPPADILQPSSFNIQFQCHRLCESPSPIATQASVLSPYVINNISPYSNCAIDLIGLYDEGNYTLANASVQTLSTVPSTPVSNIIFTSVSSGSMTVSWNEVPCDGRNGLITGYSLTYNSNIVNITGGDNRMYTLTGLLPYTNYTVSIMPYNDAGMGPSDSATQQTLESIPSAINGLILNDFSPYSLLIVWNPPTMPNGIITAYSIRYRESTSTDPYNITNTTNTQYSIVGLIPNTSYTIGVRAYTSIGPGEWTEIPAKTPLISSVQGLMVIPLNATSVYVSWTIPNISPISHYTVYYNKSTDSVLSLVNLSNTSTYGVITELTDSSTEYDFRISVTIGDFEGQLSGLVQPVLIPPNVTIVANGTQSVGQSYSMICIVSVLDLLIPSTVIQWSKTPPNDTLPSLSNGQTTSMHYIESLNTSDAGQYTCTAIISLTDIEIEEQNIDSHTITLEIPSPTLNISLSRVTDLLAGSSLNLTCSYSLDPRVNTPVTIMTEWTQGSALISANDRVIIDNSVSFQSIVYFTVLIADHDAGYYQCKVDIISGSNFVTNAFNVSNIINLNVSNPVISNFDLFPKSFLGLETSCPESDPYDNFTLTCTASKPAIVLSELMLVWTHNGTMRNGITVTTGSSNNTKTNTLTLLNTSINDSGYYECHATLNVLSDVISVDDVSIVTIKPARPPIEAQLVNVSVTDTTASINFTIPSIIYTPETYYINYIGLDLQNTLTNSSMLQSSNINDVNVTHQIVLTGLEEANDYSFIIVSTNCIGSTNTPAMNFSTLPNLPTGAPLNCTVSNIESDSVDLNWSPPNKLLQNGQILSYNVSCSFVGNNSFNTANRTLVIFDLYPYTTDTCNISAVNVVGAGPAATCSFTTAQDIPFDGPQNFISTPNKTFISFRWMAPEAPNGVIIQYNLTVTNLDTADTTVSIINVTASSNEIIESLVSGFSPYQNYTASVSASTIIGPGPMVTTAGRMLPDVSSPVLLVTIPVIISGVYITESVPSINDTAVNITWSPPLYPNGRITGYNITNDNNGRSYWIPIAESVYSYIVTELNIGVLYNFTIRAFNDLGGGESASVLAFSKPDALSIPPERVEATLSHDKTTITVNWDSKTFDDVRAFFAYKVTATTTSTRKRQSGSPIEMTVPYDATSVSLTGVDPDLMYQITVSYVTYSQDGIEITGPASNPVTPVNAVSSSTSSMVSSSSSTHSTSATSSPTITPTLSEETENSPYIIGAAIGGILVVFIILIIIVLLGTVIHKRRHTTGKMTLSTTNDPIIMVNNEVYELSAPPPTYEELTDVGRSEHLTDEEMIGVPTYEELRDVGRSEHLTDEEMIGVPTYEELRDVGRSEHLTDEEMVGVLLETEQSLRQALHEQPAHSTDDTLDEDEEQEIAEEPVYANIGDQSVFKPIHVSVFHSHVLEMHSNSDQEFDNEFKSIPMSSGAPYTIGSSEANTPKNRFLNIFPYDATRVILTTKSDSDYINACFVDGYERKNCYIAAQGPLRKTVDDFWHMIWEHKLNHIVMLTGITEAGKKKCQQYWPETIGNTLSTGSGLKVSLDSVVPFADYNIRTMSITKIGSDDVRAVTQYHFTSWPDHGVPQFATSLINFIKRVQRDHNKNKGVPLLVHCSAGVGRTGTFIMLDSMMERLRVEDTVNVHEFLTLMRANRMYLVQTLPQYIFIYDALDEMITCGNTTITATNMRIVTGRLNKKVQGKDINGYQEQLQLLNEVSYKPKESAFSDAFDSTNHSKNRYATVLPLNISRPRLYAGRGASDYINANFVDGYKRKNAYIVTQGPLESTVVDFWHMVWEFNSHSIVQLCNLEENGEEVCKKYWPPNEGAKVQYGGYKVTLQIEKISRDFVVRKLHITPNSGREGRVVTQFQYTAWPESECPPDTGSVIEMIDGLTRTQMNSGNKVITVVCNNGVGRSGAFMCLHSQLERLKTEGEIDIFKYLKSARTKRIGLLSDPVQYVFVHEVILTYIDSFDLYANFKSV